MAIQYGLTESCIVFLQNGPASDEEWGEYMAFLRRVGPKVPNLRVLVVADSGPSPKQRGIMDDATRPYIKAARIAVVARSTFVRGLVHALRLFTPAYRPFEPAEVAAALDYLDVPTSRHQAVLSSANKWCAELKMPPLKLA